MNLYDEYKNRIEKLAKVKNRLHKFRFLICSILAMIIGGAIGLMVAKGSYMSVTEISAATVNFNEPFSITPAKAFLSSSGSQKIQYAGTDGVWTDDVPYKAGAYQARTVTRKLIGYSYSKPVSFEILPLDAELTIVSSSVTYGEVPVCSVNLVNGHKLDTSGLLFKYNGSDLPASSSAEITVVESSIKIIDPATGEDFTDCYNVTCRAKNLSINKRSITVRPVDTTVTYDGNSAVIENKVTEKTLSYLASGDEIRFNSVVLKNGIPVESAVDAGIYGLHADGLTIWHGESNVTAFYDVEYLNAQLQILRRPVAVTVAGGSRQYDGTPFSYGGFTTDGNLVEGHSVELRNLPTITAVGTRLNECTVSIMNGAEDVSGNYDVITEFGRLEILPKTVKVTTDSAQKTYDGTPLFKEGFTTDDVSGVFEYTANGITEVTDYYEGGVPNVIGIRAWLDGVDVTSNFDFDYDYGTLTVNKRPVTVTTGDLNEHFNGYPQTNLSATSSNGGMANGGLLSYHSLLAVKQFTVTDVTGEAGVDNATEYAVMDGMRDVTANYEITYVYGKLIITPRPIVVQIDSYSWAYDGEEHSYTNYITYYFEDEEQFGLLNDDKLTVVAIHTKVKDYNGDGVANVVEYSAPSNYVIIGEPKAGILKITKRKIVVITNSNEWEYDGEEHYDYGYTTRFAENEGVSGLLGDDGLTVSARYAKIINVRETRAQNNVVDYKVESANYEIFEVRYGTLTITPREIIYITESESWIYDGYAHYNIEYETVWAEDESKSGLLNGDVLPFNYKTITDVFPSNVKNEFEIGITADSNYRLGECRWGVLSIMPRPIEVVTATYEWVYDGEEHSARELDVSKIKTYYLDENGERAQDLQGNAGGLIKAEETLSIDSCTAVLNVGEAENVCRFSVPNDNYKIEKYSNGTLTVTVRYLMVETASNSWTYDGEEHEDITYSTYQVSSKGERLSEIGLVNGDELAVDDDTIARITNFGDRVNDTQFKVIPVKESPVADGVYNYEIYGYDKGTLTVTQRHIAVVTATDNWTYDGKDHFNTSYESYLYDDASQEGLLGEDALTPVEDGYTVVNGFTAGVDNVVQYTLPLFEGEVYDGTNCNYDITYVYGTLSVAKRVVNIQTASAEKEYDGTALSDTDFTHDDVPDTDDDSDAFEYFAVDSTEIVNVEESGAENVFTVRAELNGVDVTLNDAGESNFDFVYTYGTLEITPRNVIVTTGTNVWTYDGQEHSETEYEKVEYAKYSKEAEKWLPAEGEALVVNAYTGEIDVLTLIEGTATVVKDFTYSTVLNECEYENSNYEVHYEYGTLTVNKRAIYIVLDDITLYYGDELPETDTYTFKTSLGGTTFETTVDGETLVAYIRFKLETVGANPSVTPKNHGIYYIAYDYGMIVSEGSSEEVSASMNYAVLFDHGTLTVERRPVTVKIDNQTSVYGSEIPGNRIELADGSLGFAYGEVLTLDYIYKKGEETVTPFDAGEYVISYSKLYIDGSEEGVDNYDLTVDSGTLTIEKLRLTVTIVDETYTYGKRIYNYGHYFAIELDVEHWYWRARNTHTTGVLVGELVETITMQTVHYSDEDGNEVTPKNVGRYSVTATAEDFEFSLYPRTGGVPVSSRPADNYDIVEIKPATLTIAPMEISVELIPFENYRFIYGETVSYATGIGNYKNADTLELGYNEKLQIAVRYMESKSGAYVTPKNVGSYIAELDIDNCTFYDEYGEALIDSEGYNFGVKNYVISCNKPIGVSIFYKMIYVSLLDYTVTYGDYGFDYDNPEDNPYVIEIGNYKTGEGISPELAYGEQLEVDGIVYYRLDGAPGSTYSTYSTFVRLSPRNVGTYLIRVDEPRLTCKIYDEYGEFIENGTFNYMIIPTMGELTIEKKTIHISLDREVSWIYGTYGAENTPGTCAHHFLTESDGLEYNDELTVNVAYYDKDGNVRVDFPGNVGEYTIKAVSFTLLYDDGFETASGSELTNYVIIVDEDGLLTITARQITVVIDSDRIIYGDELPDGFGFTVTEGAVDEEGNLPYGEVLTFDYCYKLGDEVITPVNKGEYSISYTAKYIDGSEEGVDNYDWDIVDGTLTIAARKVTVTVTDKTITYGDPVPALNPTVTADTEDGELPYGEVLVLAFNLRDKDGVEVSATEAGRLNAGTYDIVLADVGIEGGNGLIENYDVSYELGILEVEALEVTVEISGVTVTYGEDFEIRYEITSETTLVEGEELYLSFAFTKDGVEYDETENRPVNVGTYVISVAGATVTGGQGNAENYKFDYVINGGLSILKRNVTVTTSGKVSVYGDGFDLDDPTVTTDTEDGRLPYGETFTYEIYLDGAAYDGALLYVGEYVVRQHVATAGGTQAGVNNYNIDYVDGTLEITARKVTVSLFDLGIQYGDDHAYPDGRGNYKEGIIPEGFVTGDHLEINAVKYYTQDGTEAEHFNAGTYVVKVDVESDGGYTVYDASGKVISRDNYDIEWVDGSLTVVPRDIAVQVGDNECKYGEELPAPGLTITKGAMDDDGALPYGESLEVEYHYEQNGRTVTPSDAGEYDIVVSVKGVNGEHGSLDNYDITANPGTLTINAREVTITVTDAECEYGDKLPELNVKVVGTVDGETLNVTFKLISKEDSSEYGATTDERLNAGVYAIALDEMTVTGGNGKVDNYTISYSPATLEITRKAVTVKVTDKDAVYGEALPALLPEIEGMVSGEELNVTFKFVKDGNEYGESDSLRLGVGVYAIEQQSVSVSYGNERAENYDIDFNLGNLEIIQATLGPIVLNAEILDFAYGDDYDKSITNVEVTGAYGQKIVIKVTYAPVAPAAGLRARAAAAYASRAAEDGAFVPKDVGEYVATLDWNSCLIYDGDELVEEGIANYYEPNSPQLQFKIIPLELFITVSGNALVYGEELPEISSVADKELPYGETYNITYKFNKDGTFYNQTDYKPVLAGNYTIEPDAITFTADGVSVNADNYKVEYAKNSPVLTIEKRQISVALRDDIKFAFGDVGAYPVEPGNYKQGAYAPDLVPGDVLTVTSVTFVKLDDSGRKVGEPTTAPTEAGLYAIVFMSGGFTVTNNGLDVTYCYELSHDAVTDGLLEISASVIYVRTLDGEWEYDGQWHNVGREEYGTITPVEGSLPEGYEIVIDDADTFIGVKDVTGVEGVRNDTRFKVLYNGVETDNLIVVVKEEYRGVLVIYARKIVIGTDTLTKPYEGTPLDGMTESNPDGYTVVYSGDNPEATFALAPGDSIRVFNYPSVTNVSEGVVSNELTYDIVNIVNGRYQSVFGNYEITAENWGTLEITPLNVAISIDDLTDGDAVCYGENINVTFTVYIDGVVSRLPNGELFSFATGYFTNSYKEIMPGTYTDVNGTLYTLIDVGSYRIRQKGDITVVGGEEENYRILGGEASEGRLTITERLVSVATRNGGMDGEWIYDGYPHSMPEYDNAFALDGSKEGLLGGDEIILITEWRTITDVGEIENYVEFSVPANYRIAAQAFGMLKVSARRITIRTGTIGADGSIIYDGEEYSTDSYSIVSPLGLASGQELVVDTLFKYSDATGMAGVVNETTFKVMAGAADVTSNYVIAYDTANPGKIIIMPRPITIGSNDVVATYDGQRHGDSTIIYDPAQLVSGHRIEVFGSSSYYDANLPNGMPNILNFSILNGAGEDKTGNYEIRYENGTIFISPARLTVSMRSGMSFMYGEDYESELVLPVNFVNDARFTNVTFVPAYRLNRTFMGVGDYVAILIAESCYVTYEWNNTVFFDGMDNYELIVENGQGEFVVTERQIALNLASGVTVSYGTSADALVARLTSGMSADTAYGERFEYALTYYLNGVRMDGYPVNAGSYTVQIDWANCKVYDNKGNLKEGGLANYALTNAGAAVTLTVTAATVTVTMNSIGEVKYGEDYSYGDWIGNYLSAAGLQYGEKLKVQPVYMHNGTVIEGLPAFAGEYDIALNIGTVEVYSASGSLLVGGASNYTFVCNAENYGKLIIKGVNVTVTRQNIEVDYSGYPYALADSITGASDEVALTYMTSEGTEAAFTLPAGHTLKLRSSFVTQSANAGTYPNTAEYYICDEYGNESGEYIVTTVGVASITIKKKDVRIALVDWTTVVYDGEVHNMQSGKYSVIGSFVNGETLDTVAYEFSAETGTAAVPVDAGSYVVRLSLSDSKMSDGNSLATNYNVIWADGKQESDFTISKKSLTVKLVAEDIAYGDNVSVTFEVDGLISGETFRGAYVLDRTATAVGLYTAEIKWDSCIVINGRGRDGLKNYEISEESVDSVKFNVTARNITVTINSAACAYGEELPEPAFTVTDGWFIEYGKLPYGETLTVDYHYEQGANKDVTPVAVGEYDVVGKVIYVNGNTDGLSNYNISYEYGKLIIGKRTVHIITGSKDKTYDGEELSDASVECYYIDASGNRQEGLVGDDALELIGTLVTVIDATSGSGVANENRYRILSDGVESENYEIDYTFGWLRIDRKDLTITLSGLNSSYEYGDRSFLDETGYTDVEGLVERTVDGVKVKEKLNAVLGFYLNGNPVASPKDVAEGYVVSLDLAASSVDNGSGVNGISNYNVICSPVTFDIIKKKVTLALAEKWEDKVYNGETQNMQEGKLTIPDGAFAYGETLETVVYDFFTLTGDSTVPVDAGSYIVKLFLGGSRMSDGNPLGANYEVIFDGGKDRSSYEITRKDVTLKLKGVSVDYDGNVHDYRNIVGAYTVEGLCGSDAIELDVEYDGIPKDATEYTVTLNEIVFLTGNKGNYNINISGDGSLTINRRQITIKIASRTVEKDDEQSMVYGISDVTHAYKGEDGTGFVYDELETAFANRELKFVRSDDLGASAEQLAKGIVEIYEYTLDADRDGEILKNYAFDTPQAGVLTVTKIMIEVQAIAVSKTYDGTPANGFSFTHVRYSDPEKPAFSDEELKQITAIYTIVNDDDGSVYTVTVDGNGNVTDKGPVNAGSYTVTLTLTGTPVSGYYIVNEDYGMKTSLVIATRDVIIEVLHDTLYPQTAKYGDINVNDILDHIEGVKAEQREGDRGLIEEITDFTYGLAYDDYFIKLVSGTKLNVGYYLIAVTFEGMSNYNVIMDSWYLLIEQRELVISPVDPYSGVAREYQGSAIFLKGGEGYYQLLKDTTLATGDTLEIQTGALSVSVTEGYVYIEHVWINGGIDNDNYKIYINAQSTDLIISGLTLANFRLKLYYVVKTIEYEQVMPGMRYNYSGTANEVPIPDNIVGGLINILSGEIPENHEVALSRSSISFTDAGVYTDWFHSYLQVVNSDKKKVACYVFQKKNSSDADNVVVSKQEINVNITVDRAALIDAYSANSLPTSEIDGNKMLVDGVTVQGLLAGHKCEVLVFKVENEFVLGVTVFSVNANNKRKDVISNYECTITLDDYGTAEGYTFVARAIAVDEIKTLACPVLRVKLPSDLDANNILNPDVSTLKDGVYHLNSYEFSGLTDTVNHGVIVVVYGKDGALTVGIVVTKKSATGSVSDASNLYNVVWNEIAGLNVEVISYSDYKSLVRTVIVDLTGAFNGDGTPIVDAAGKLQNVVPVSGLMVSDKYTHKVEIYYVGGVYKVIVYQENVQSSGKILRSDKREVYDFIFRCPDGMSFSYVMVDVTEFYPKN